MASAQVSMRPSHKEVPLPRGSSRRPSRTRVTEVPLKKRLTAEISLKQHRGPPGGAKIKREQLEEKEEAQQEEEAGWGHALDLSPGIRHTLAQFTLSSQSSLGGPAAFSARGGRDEVTVALPPLPPPPAGPLLAPCDSSAELKHTVLEGEPISCFTVGGEKRLCLPQVLNSVLRAFSLQQINGICDELYVYCSRCRGNQLHALKASGVLPPDAPSCGLITLTDAQRLCNALLRPGRPAPPTTPPVPFPLREGGSTFQVEHRCLGKGRGLFAGLLYEHPDASCIQCAQCGLLFSPCRFVMHSHRPPDRRTCHWGFDSARWPRYLQLGRKYLGTIQEAPYRRLLQEMKEKYSQRNRKRPYDTNDDDEEVDEEAQLKRSHTLYDGDADQKSAGRPDVKEEPCLTTVTPPSYFLYRCEDGQTALGKAGAPDGMGVLSALLKQHYSLQGAPAPAVADGEAAYQHADWRQLQPVAMEMWRSKSTHAVPAVEDRERVALEMVQLYSRQQEVLRRTLQKHKQLEMELEGLRRHGAGDQQKPLKMDRAEHTQAEKADCTEHAQTEREADLTECAQTENVPDCTERAQTVKAADRTEHAQMEQEADCTVCAQMEQEADCTERAQTEQEADCTLKSGEQKSELRRQRACQCLHSRESLPEAHYAAQLSELRRRLDRAEEDREELQEALRQEREARERLERVIAQLRQQLSEPHPVTGPTDPAGSPAPS
nr:ski-like protein isoform X1 [Paramormyrops kingsleyae]XP_023686172.1 ski-like protein isoform X1 [Paramormyrops kingsleyae]